MTFYFRQPRHDLDAAEAIFAAFLGPDAVEYAMEKELARQAYQACLPEQTPYETAAARIGLKGGKRGSMCGGSGACGALWAACCLRPDLEDIFLQEFRTRAGAVECRQILSNRLLDCRRCVALAQELLEDYLERPCEPPFVKWWGFYEDKG